MSDSNGRETSRLRRLLQRDTTRIFDVYSPRKLPDDMTEEPKLRGFVGHQRPGDSSSNQSEPSGSTPTSERSDEPEIARSRTMPADQEQQ